MSVDIQTVRFTAQCGLSVKWTIAKRTNGKYKVFSAGEMRANGQAIPVDLAPYEISNAVINSPDFETKEEALAFVKSI